MLPPTRTLSPPPPEFPLTCHATMSRGRGLHIYRNEASKVTSFDTVLLLSGVFHRAGRIDSGKFAISAFLPSHHCVQHLVIFAELIITGIGIMQAAMCMENILERYRGVGSSVGHHCPCHQKPSCTVGPVLLLQKVERVRGRSD